MKPVPRSSAAKPALRKSDNNLFFASPKEHLEFINTGCEVLNCVIGGGWALGRIHNVVGDKSTGKTLLAIEAMANFKRQFPEGSVKYDETEAAFDDHYASALGLDLQEDERVSSETVEDLFNNLRAFCKKVKGHGLYIVDSLDALSDRAEMARGIEESTYGASKPKQLGQLFRRTVKLLENTNVCLIVISQIRDAIGVTFGNKHTRSGGKALDFYASVIMWLANTGQNKKTVKGVQRTVGVGIKARTSKNKIGQPYRECSFEILFGYGIDDVAGNLNFLKEADALGDVDIESDRALTLFKKNFHNMSQKEQAQVRRKIGKAVRENWYRIEQSFTPTRGKYA